jgi:hypothetical protein
MQVNAESGTEIPEKYSIGEGGKIFSLPDPLGAGLEMQVYLFTVQQVGEKIFFANIPRGRQEQILAKTITHINDALACGPLPDPLPPFPLQIDVRWPKGPPGV